MRLIAAATLLALTSVAAAQPPGLTPVIVPVPEPAPLPSDYVDSYRAQTLGADGIAVGLVVLAAISAGATSNGGRSYSTSLLELSLATYLIGGPLVHLLHDRPGRAAASLGIRVGLPILLGFAGAGLNSLSNSCGDSYYDGCSDDNSTGAALGVILGGIAAVVIDAAVFAKADEPPGALHLTAMPLRGGVSFGVASAF